MNINQESNILTFEAANALERYAEYVSGTTNGTLAVISHRSLSPAAQDALEKSAERLGFGTTGILWVTCEPEEAQSLDAANTKTLLTALDPLAFVVTDAAAADLLGAAFGKPVERDAAGRLQCRNVIAFVNFTNMLNAPEDKQRAWALLKQLA